MQVPSIDGIIDRLIFDNKSDTVLNRFGDLVFDDDAPRDLAEDDDVAVLLRKHGL